jgi:hypothetical protein
MLGMLWVSGGSVKEIIADATERFYDNSFSYLLAVVLGFVGCASVVGSGFRYFLYVKDFLQPKEVLLIVVIACLVLWVVDVFNVVVERVVSAF